MTGARKRPGTPDNGQAAKRDSLWVEMDRATHNRVEWRLTLVLSPLAKPLQLSAALGGELMLDSEMPAVAEAVGEIAEILAKAYLRYSQLPLTDAPPGAIRSTQALDNTGEPSPHELTLTGQRRPGKESAH